MREILKVGPSGNAIISLAIGDGYLANWERNAMPTLKRYCANNNLGLYIQDESLDHAPNRKKFTWQKLLLPEQLKKQFPKVKRFCYLDSDVIANPFRESVFEEIPGGNLGLVSQFKNLPLPLDKVLRTIAYFRNQYYDKEYPLDSALFMTPEQIFGYHGFPVKNDYACMGFILGDVEKHSLEFLDIYHKYDSQVFSITGGGDEPILNYEFQNRDDLKWLPYEYQAIWIFEMAWKYPFLYKSNQSSETLIRECVDASLLGNTFLHFAGSWGESKMIGVGDFLKELDQFYENFFAYQSKPVSGSAVGLIRPQVKEII